MQIPSTIARLRYWWLLPFIAICSGILDFYTPAMGDDLSFWASLGLENYRCPNRATLSFIAGHIFGCNGRLFDFMGPVIINLLPRAVASIVMGAMWWMLFRSMLLVAKIPHDGRHSAFVAAFLAVSVAVLPWWDVIWLRVVQFNYPWSLTFCLLFLHCWYSIRRRNALLMLALGVVASASHEQSAVAMCAVFLPMAVLVKPLSTTRRCLLIGLLCGAVISLGAPSFWHRLSGAEPDFGPLTMILTTLPVYALLVVIILFLSAFECGRKMLKHLVPGPWFACVAVGAIAAIVAIYGGIPGRTGWLSEGVALVALAHMALSIRCKLSRSLAIAIYSASSLFIVVHYCVSVNWQYRAYNEYAQMLTQFRTAPDGIVYLDASVSRFAPPPITLYRVKGTPDADDFHLINVLSQTYRQGRVSPVILPECFRGKLNNFADSIECNGITVYAALPSDVVLTEDNTLFHHYNSQSPRIIHRIHTAAGHELWASYPWICDPGDSRKPIKKKL